MPAIKYRLYRRANGIYYREDTLTKVQVSLRTKEKHAALEKLRAANESVAQPRLNLDLARIYLQAHDRDSTERTWEMVMTAYSERGRDSSRRRCRQAFSGRDFDPIRSMKIIETKAEDLLRVLHTGKSSVNHYLRRLVHHAENLGWLHWMIMAPAACRKASHRVCRPAGARRPRSPHGPPLRWCPPGTMRVALLPDAPRRPRRAAAHHPPPTYGGVLRPAGAARPSAGRTRHRAASGSPNGPKRVPRVYKTQEPDRPGRRHPRRHDRRTDQHQDVSNTRGMAVPGLIPGQVCSYSEWSNPVGYMSL